MKRPAPLRILWDHHKPTLALLVLALAVALFFASRFVLHWVYWHDQRATHPDLEPWMTVGFIAHSWHRPPESVAVLIGNPDDLRRKSLEDIAKDQNRPVEDLIAELTALLETDRP
ncbi:hypothetical protein [Thalassovita aquimarina]|uniref:Uncharacterized protein n=1 Tax=Thalassovita aquimarina TaxID=2785917 RepID=A0ABS5HWN1_9RHOB|nr:hypothetical protein [Thalassovita aquimarina]MBR9653387.1 hypothetical protein [Thalassovita aquimarina]